VVRLTGPASVGWAWLHRPTPAPVDPNDSAAQFDASAEGGPDGGSSFTGPAPGGSTVLDGGGVDPSTQPPTTNADWTRRVIDYLAGALGYDAPTVSAALGKYLARQPIAPGTEQNIIQSALAAWGAPPQGNFSVVLQPPPVVPPPKPAPTVKEAVKFVRMGRVGVMIPLRGYIATLSLGSGAGPNAIEMNLRNTVNDPRNARYRASYSGTGNYPGGAAVYVHYSVKG